MPGRQRRRRRGPAQYQGPRRAKPPFPINLLFNVKAFYLFFIVLMIASLGAAGLAGGLGSSGPRNTPPIPSPGETSPTPNASLSFAAAAPTIDGAKPHIAIIKTTKGDIKIELATDAPKAVNSFAFLAGKGFYDGTTFFYVDHNFVAQAGDPTCKVGGKTKCSGVGGPGYSLPVEPTTERHEQWAVVAPTLAEGEQAVHGSQFRVLYQADSRLDGRETVFGKIGDRKSQEILTSLNNLAPCTIVSTATCDRDLSSALMIEEVIVQPA